MVAARPARRAAGVRFEVVPPPLPQVLPRMDVAAFVGFAASGPLDIPVLVDDPAHFESIFGSDAPLAWDDAAGAVLSSYLAPTVRAFFQGGGQRCWVIRVAGAGVTNRFPVSGLLVRAADGSLEPATVLARSQGSWSDDLTVAASLLSRPLGLGGRGAGAFPAWVEVVTRAPDDVVVGDLVQLTFFESGGAGPVKGRVAMFAVGAIETRAPLGPFNATTRLSPTVAASGAPDVAWFRTTLPAVPPSSAGTATIGPSEVPAWLLTSVGGGFQVRVQLPFSEAPNPGTTLRVAFGGDELWMTVASAVAADASTSPVMPEGVVLSGQGLFVDRAPAPAPSSAPEVERLQLALSTRAAAQAVAVLGNLGFGGSHPRPLWALPSDTELFRGADDTTDTDARSVELRRLADPLASLWSDAAEPRFDLAVAADPGVAFLPIGMPFSADYPLPRFPVAQTALERDGLAAFDASLFLDPDLSGVGADALLGEANFLRYQSSEPRRLRGIHAALGVEEATLIAVPDAALPGWRAAPTATPPAGAPAAPVVPGSAGAFFPCGRRALPLPVLNTPIVPDSRGTFLLSWAPVPGAQRYEVEETSDPEFKRDVVTYKTTEPQVVVYGHAPGYFYVRARALAGALDSGWSAAVGAVFAVGSGWVVSPPPGSPGTQSAALVLATVQGALVQMCAARGDLFALLPLPASLTAAAAATYVSTLCANIPPPSLGYGAVYHPWLVVRDTASGSLRTIPPDGAIAGVVARRTIARGAWVAPANEPLAASVLGLAPRAPDDAWVVLDAQPVNRIREEARGLMTMSADTLALDPDLIPINVRRLLMLLRRAALGLGNTYVFEPNDDVLARAVAGTFSSLLDALFQRGALAGATASQAYRVITDATVNPPSSVETGRFVVELQVAPSRPLAFLTVRLVQTGEQLTVSEGS